MPVGKPKKTEAAKPAAKTKVTKPADSAEQADATKTGDAVEVADEAASTTDPANRGPDHPDGPGVKSAGTEPDDGSEDADDDDAEDQAEDDDADEDAKSIGKGDGVTMRSNDGVTYQTNDGATGGADHDGEPQTKAGDAPEGVNRDLNPGERAATGAMSHGDAVVAELAPAAALHGPKVRGDITKGTLLVLGDFASKKEGTFTNQANLHDDLGIERAEIPSLCAEIEKEFDVTITVSEAQNWLLVRDVVNTVLRKVAAQGE